MFIVKRFDHIIGKRYISTCYVCMYGCPGRHAGIIYKDKTTTKKVAWIFAQIIPESIGKFLL